MFENEEHDQKLQLDCRQSEAFGDDCHLASNLFPLKRKILLINILTLNKVPKKIKNMFYLLLCGRREGLCSVLTCCTGTFVFIIFLCSPLEVRLGNSCWNCIERCAKYVGGTIGTSTIFFAHVLPSG